MDLSKIPLISAIKDRMHWLNKNQAVISGNIANADTPGYKPKALDKQDFSGLVEQFNGSEKPGGIQTASLQTTQRGHLSLGSNGTTRVVDAPVDHEAPDGNAVNLEDQLLKVAENQMEYGLMVQLYRKQVGLLRTALRSRGQG